MSVTAIIVLYNPDMLLLQEQYISLYSQVEHIVYVDNSEEESIKNKFQSWLNNNKSNNIFYIDLNKNKGIAYAQNEGITLAARLESSFIMLMDQDSVLPINMIKSLLTTYSDLEQQGKNVATVGPMFIDDKTLDKSKVVNYKFLYRTKVEPKNGEVLKADAIIASGSIIKKSTIDKIGLMSEELFIDAVDTEWCLRAKKLGYYSYIDSSVVMRHSIGDSHINILGKKIVLHSDFRNYFIVRNNIYLIFYKRLLLNWKLNQSVKTVIYIYFYSVFSKRPLYSFFLLNRAFLDGIFKNMGKGYFKDK